MKLDAIHAGLEGVYGADRETGEALYKLVLETQAQAVLHTGWKTPGALCYLAGALHELGKGRVLALDDALPGKTHASVDAAIVALGLQGCIERRQSEAGRTWLLQELSKETGGQARFDLVFLESARDLTLDGFTLMLAERWLKPRGVLALSGLHWTWGSSPKLKDTPAVRAMPLPLRTTPHANLLVESIAKRGGVLEEVTVTSQYAVFRKRERITARMRRVLGVSSTPNFPTVSSSTPVATQPSAASKPAAPAAPTFMQQCPLCGHEAPVFLRHARKGHPGRANTKCPNCNSFERHRLIWLYFQRRTNLLEMPRKRFLHIAPEACLEPLLRNHPAIDYLSGDLESPWHPAMVVMDITDIKDYKEGDFDVVYANHVLEHVPEDRKAIKEIYRVLSPGGWAILQVPIVFEKTFEDPSIVTKVDRERFYKHPLHIRAYGLDYKERLEEAGFRVDVVPFYDQLSEEERKRYALKPQEAVYHCHKPA